MNNSVLCVKPGNVRGVTWINAFTHKGLVQNNCRVAYWCLVGWKPHGGVRLNIKLLAPCYLEEIVIASLEKQQQQKKNLDCGVFSLLFKWQMTQTGRCIAASSLANTLLFAQWCLNLVAEGGCTESIPTSPCIGSNASVKRVLMVIGAATFSFRVQH